MILRSELKQNAKNQLKNTKNDIILYNFNPYMYSMSKFKFIINENKFFY